MVDFSTNPSVDAAAVETPTRWGFTLRRMIWSFIVLALTVGIAFSLYFTASPRYTDEYFLAKIPVSLKADSDITSYLVKRMRQIEHVDGGPMRNWVTAVAPIRRMTSPSPTIDPDLIFARLLISNRENGILPTLKRVPGIGNLVPWGNASRGGNFHLTIIFDKTSKVPSEIVGHDGGLATFLRDKKVSLKTKDDEVKLWNFFTALNLCHGIAQNAIWLTAEKCEMVLTSAPKFKVFVVVTVDKNGFIHNCKLDSR